MSTYRKHLLYILTIVLSVAKLSERSEYKANAMFNPQCRTTPTLRLAASGWKRVAPHQDPCPCGVQVQSYERFLKRQSIYLFFTKKSSGFLLSLKIIMYFASQSKTMLIVDCWRCQLRVIKMPSHGVGDAIYGGIVGFVLILCRDLPSPLGIPVFIRVSRREVSK